MSQSLRLSTATSVRDRNPIAVLLVAALAPAVWGSTYFVTSQFLPPGRPMTSAALRAIPAGVLLQVLRPGLPPPGWRLRTVVLGMLNIGVFFPLLFVAAYRLPGGVASIVGAMQPLLIAGVGALLGWTRPSRTQTFWSIIAAFGVALVAFSGKHRFDAWGLMAAVAATSSMAGGLLLTRRWGRPAEMHPLTLTSCQLLVGGVCIAPLIGIFDTGLWVMSLRTIGGYVWLSVIGGAIAYAVWFRAARVLPATNMALLGLLSPVVASLLGWLRLDQVLTFRQGIGVVLALVGAAAGQRNLSGQSEPVQA